VSGSCAIVGKATKRIARDKSLARIELLIGLSKKAVTAKHMPKDLQVYDSWIAASKPCVASIGYSPKFWEIPPKPAIDPLG